MKKVTSTESLEAIKVRLKEFSIRTRDEATARVDLPRDSEAVLESIAVLCGAVHERRSKD